MTPNTCQFDETRWPLVTVRWSGALADADLADLIQRLDRWLERGERFGLLIDARGGRGLSAEQRRRVLAHMKEAAPRTALWLVQAIVHDNAVMRTLNNAINYVFPRPFVNKAFGDADEAMAWLTEELRCAPAPPQPAPRPGP